MYILIPVAPSMLYTTWVRSSLRRLLQPCQSSFTEGGCPNWPTRSYQASVADGLRASFSTHVCSVLSFIFTALVISIWAVGALHPSIAESFGPFPAGTTVFVDSTNLGSAGGTAANPFNTIRKAMDAAKSGDVVGVAPGTYRETVVMKSDIDLLGAGATVTTIDAQASGSGVICADRATLDGFLITNAGGLNSRGIDCVNGTSPLISNNIVSGNNATGIGLFNSSATIRANKISGNPAFVSSCPCDAIVSSQSAPAIVNNTIDASDPNGNLSAITLSGTSALLMEGFTISDNRITGRISMFGITSDRPLNNVISNNVIVAGNTFSETINIAFSKNAGTITNNTLVGGGGIFEQGESVVAITNNIIAFGRQGIGGLGAILPNGPLLFKNNDVFGNAINYSGSLPDQTGVNGNISVDPRFVDQDNNDFHLKFGSPAVDAGTSDGCPAADRDGIVRPQGQSCDIGAYEFAPLIFSLNRSTFHTGDTLRLGLRVQSAQPAFNADLYFAILTPDGATICLVTRLSPLLGQCLPQSNGLDTFPRLASNIFVPQGLDISVAELMVYTFGGVEATGAYSVFLLLTAPDALRDRSIDPGDIIAVGSQSFTYSR
jgi:parallel beta-helix repeat protein